MALYPVRFSVDGQNGAICRLSFVGDNANCSFIINYMRVTELGDAISVQMLYRNPAPIPTSNLININQTSIEFRAYSVSIGPEGNVSRSQIDCLVENFDEFVAFARQWIEDRAAEAAAEAAIEDDDEEIISVPGTPPNPGGSPNS